MVFRPKVLGATWDRLWLGQQYVLQASLRVPTELFIYYHRVMRSAKSAML